MFHAEPRPGTLQRESISWPANFDKHLDIIFEVWFIITRKCRIWATDRESVLQCQGGNQDWWKAVGHWTFKGKRRPFFRGRSSKAVSEKNSTVGLLEWLQSRSLLQSLSEQLCPFAKCESRHYSTLSLQPWLWSVWCHFCCSFNWQALLLSHFLSICL